MRGTILLTPKPYHVKVYDIIYAERWQNPYNRGHFATSDVGTKVHGNPPLKILCLLLYNIRKDCYTFYMLCWVLQLVSIGRATIPDKHWTGVVLFFGIMQPCFSNPF